MALIQGNITLNSIDNITSNCVYGCVTILNAKNYGTINKSAYFCGTGSCRSVNFGTVGDCAFFYNSDNESCFIRDAAYFLYNSSNNANLSGLNKSLNGISVEFCNSYNFGNIYSPNYVYFYGNSINYGQVDNAIFTDCSINCGLVKYNVFFSDFSKNCFAFASGSNLSGITFYKNSKNYCSSTGKIYFADNSSNESGVVCSIYNPFFEKGTSCISGDSIIRYYPSCTGIVGYQLAFYNDNIFYSDGCFVNNIRQAGDDYYYLSKDNSLYYKNPISSLDKTSLATGCLKKNLVSTYSWYYSGIQLTATLNALGNGLGVVKDESQNNVTGIFYGGILSDCIPISYKGPVTNSYITSKYFISGVMTTLNSLGCGIYNSRCYRNGNLWTGPVGTAFFENGCCTYLTTTRSGATPYQYPVLLYKSSGLYGSGFQYCDGTSASICANGYKPLWIAGTSWSSLYFISGQKTSLTALGDGKWFNKYEDILTKSGRAFNYVNAIEISPLNGYCILCNTFDGGNYPQRYYINGYQTNLDSLGNGVVSYGACSSIQYVNGVMMSSVSNANIAGIRYLNGVATTLDSLGNGIWQGIQYINDMPANGLVSTIYYVNGIATTLPSDGNGISNGKYYINGILMQGWDSYTDKYYSDGIQTELDTNGSGIWNNRYYVSGFLYSGYSIELSYYFINGYVTTLDPNGNGYTFVDLDYSYYINGEKSFFDEFGVGFKDGIYYPASFKGWCGLKKCNNGVIADVDYGTAYYLYGRKTTLDEDGNGCWFNRYWQNGCLSTLPLSSSGMGWGIFYGDFYNFFNNSVNFGSFCSNICTNFYDPISLAPSPNSICVLDLFFPEVDNGIVQYSSNVYLYDEQFYRIDTTSMCVQTLKDQGFKYFYNGILANGANIPYKVKDVYCNTINEWVWDMVLCGMPNPRVPMLAQGYNISDNFYYIAGSRTTLDQNGNGFWLGQYYINGVGTNLPSSGTGYYSGKYYINGVQTTLSSSGNGVWNNGYYENALLMVTTGYYSTKYYINGVQTTLPSNGTGYYSGKYYISGVQTTLPSNGTGYYSTKYYISGVETPLDANGDGIWNGYIYINGIKQI